MPIGSIFAVRKENGACSTLFPALEPPVIPNAADLEDFPPAPRNRRARRSHRVFFRAPNVDSVIYFVQRSWPGVRGAPQAHLKIISGRPPRSLELLVAPWLELTGFVPDLRPHLASAAAVIVPVRLGRYPLKIVEAMAMGKAMSTTLGTEGIEAVPGKDLLMEDHPEAFGDSVNRLLAMPNSRRASANLQGAWRRSGLAGTAPLLRRHSGWSAAGNLPMTTRIRLTLIFTSKRIGAGRAR
jgi:glycosyltransferase involved in cell wall biosynthesis